MVTQSSIHGSNRLRGLQEVSRVVDAGRASVLPRRLLSRPGNVYGIPTGSSQDGWT